MKDYQQLCVIRAMVDDLNMPLKIVPIETVREPDGLAMSSRNVFLTFEERKRAVGLYMALCAAEEEITDGETQIEQVEKTLRHIIEKHGIAVNYASVRDAQNMNEVTVIDRPIVMVVAGKLGTVRLLDNKVVPTGK
jgi:pantoate--beta-alanine ligase